MTGVLTREEMHNRVDSVFDAIEDHYDEDAVAVVGGISSDNISTHSPTDSNDRDVHTADLSLGWAKYVFDGGLSFSETLRTSPDNAMLGTLVIPQDRAWDVTQAALDGDEEARAALGDGRPEEWTGGDDA